MRTAVLLLLVLLVAGCGGGDEEATSGDSASAVETSVDGTDDDQGVASSDGGLRSSATSGGSEGDTATTSTTSSATTEEAELDVFDVGVGDCFNDFSIGEVETVAGRACEADHLYEVYAAFDIADGDFPGEDEVTTLATDGCLERFEDFVDEPYETSILDISFLTPTDESWLLGNDREVLCLVANVDQTPRSGSANGLGA
jgi:hypothetical protein